MAKPRVSKNRDRWTVTLIQTSFVYDTGYVETTYFYDTWSQAQFNAVQMSYYDHA